MLMMKTDANAAGVPPEFIKIWVKREGVPSSRRRVHVQTKPMIRWDRFMYQVRRARALGTMPDVSPCPLLCTPPSPSLPQLQQDMDMEDVDGVFTEKQMEPAVVDMPIWRIQTLMEGDADEEYVVKYPEGAVRADRSTQTPQL